MRMIIKCAVCQKELGVVDKPEITDEDRVKYQEMTRCDEHQEQPQTEVTED